MSVFVRITVSVLRSPLTADDKICSLFSGEKGYIITNVFEHKARQSSNDTLDVKLTLQNWKTTREFTFK
jgi:hypothetical protein